MEPFFIFCMMLVIYCGYLTFRDLLKDCNVEDKDQVIHEPSRTLQPQREGAPSVRKRFSRAGVQIPQLSRLPV